MMMATATRTEPHGRIRALAALVLAAYVVVDSQQPSPAFTAKELTAPARTSWLKNGDFL